MVCHRPFSVAGTAQCVCGIVQHGGRVVALPCQPGVEAGPFSLVQPRVRGRGHKPGPSEKPRSRGALPSLCPQSDIQGDLS